MRAAPRNAPTPTTTISAPAPPRSRSPTLCTAPPSSTPPSSRIVPAARRGEVTVDELPLPADQHAEPAFAVLSKNWEEATLAGAKSGQSPKLLKVRARPAHAAGEGAGSRVRVAGREGGRARWHSRIKRGSDAAATAAAPPTPSHPTHAPRAAWGTLVPARSLWHVAQSLPPGAAAPGAGPRRRRRHYHTRAHRASADRPAPSPPAPALLPPGPVEDLRQGRHEGRHLVSLPPETACRQCSARRRRAAPARTSSPPPPRLPCPAHRKLMWSVFVIMGAYFFTRSILMCAPAPHPPVSPAPPRPACSRQAGDPLPVGRPRGGHCHPVAACLPGGRVLAARRGHRVRRRPAPVLLRLQVRCRGAAGRLRGCAAWCLCA